VNVGVDSSFSLSFRFSASAPRSWNRTLAPPRCPGLLLLRFPFLRSHLASFPHSSIVRPRAISLLSLSPFLPPFHPSPHAPTFCFLAAPESVASSAAGTTTSLVTAGGVIFVVRLAVFLLGFLRGGGAGAGGVGGGLRRRRRSDEECMYLKQDRQDRQRQDRQSGRQDQIGMRGVHHICKGLLFLRHGPSSQAKQDTKHDLARRNANRICKNASKKASGFGFVSSSLLLEHCCPLAASAPCFVYPPPPAAFSERRQKIREVCH